MIETKIEWYDDLSVGIDEIDQQHKELLNILNELHDVLSRPNNQVQVLHLVNKLALYTKVHFAVEESLMRILGYPKYDGHKKHHEDLVKQVEEFKDEIGNGKIQIGVELYTFLLKWLTIHILRDDKEYSAYFIQKGVETKSNKPFWKFWG